MQGRAAGYSVRPVTGKRNTIGFGPDNGREEMNHAFAGYREDGRRGAAASPACETPLS